MKYIGFTNKYYTLWEVDTDGKYMYYTYKQNLSFDLDKAKAKEPSAIVDLSLRGHSSFKTDYIPTDCYQFGQYRGQRFADVDDIGYLVWYHNVCKDEKMQKNPRAVLIGKGYKLWNNSLMVSAQEFEERTRLQPYFPHFKSKVEAYEPFKFKATKNVSKNGYMTIPFCKISFSSTEEREYNGVKYYLPCNCNGEGTRIKGRYVCIDIYDYEEIDDMTYKIKVIAFHTEDC